MKRWGIVLAAVGLLALLFALLPPRDDGLDWIRAYGGKEQHWTRPEVEPGSYWTSYQFLFDQEPPGLESELISRAKSVETQSPGLLGATLRDGWRVSFNAKEGVLFIDRYVQPNWFDRQWNSLKRFIGVK
jgi:hypothetical protein